MDRELVFELPNDLRCIEEAVEFVVARCATCRAASAKLRFNFRVSLTEALANAMIYGNGRDPDKRVRVEIALAGHHLEARITDQGRGFDPTSLPDPTTPGNLLDPGGRGIFLMRKLMDDVRFNEQGNAVTLVLRLPAAAEMRREASA
ncbi:MAG: ATP-binding protein [Gemmatimonadales bacterium]|nr:MAG: ATP-binding protein [Gemmatimonadales bacterium]